MKNEFQFRAWSRSCGDSEGKISKRCLDERLYLDIWRSDGTRVKQFLVPKGTEDAIFELVEAHSKQYPNEKLCGCGEFDYCEIHGATP